MYTLFVSSDCGISYFETKKSPSLEDLQPTSDSLDENFLRWYIEKDGGDIVTDRICAMHKGILAFVTPIDLRK